jgi:endonuclease III
MPVDPKFLMPPDSIEDAAEFLANTFFPKGEIDPYNFQVVLQWILSQELEDAEVAYALEKFYQRMIENGYAS